MFLKFTDIIFMLTLYPFFHFPKVDAFVWENLPPWYPFSWYMFQNGNPGSTLNWAGLLIVYSSFWITFVSIYFQPKITYHYESFLTNLVKPFFVEKFKQLKAFLNDINFISNKELKNNKPLDEPFICRCPYELEQTQNVFLEKIFKFIDMISGISNGYGVLFLIGFFSFCYIFFLCLILKNTK
jgi:hypothetical protein